jgi:hypothetical protein
MDPNANLDEQRRIIARLQRGWTFHTEHGVAVPDAMDDLTRLADLVEALDDWLSAGGVLPQAWQPKRVN